MSPLGRSITFELRAAMGIIGTTSNIEPRHLRQACEALVTNALFHVCKTSEMEAARADVFERTSDLASAIEAVGAPPEEAGPAVDAARARAMAAFEALIETIADAQVTPVGRMLGVA